MRDTIDMAREAGAHPSHNPELWDIWEVSNEALKAFEALVRADEREACAKLCEAVRDTIWEYHEDHLKAAACNVCTHLAVAIRARGQA
jgi:hypothetical protein